MTENPIPVDGPGNDRASSVGTAPGAPDEGHSATNTSSVSMESPTFVTQTRAERVESGAPMGTGSPSGGSHVSTRTTTFAGDPAYRGVQTVWTLLGITELIVGLRVLFHALAASDTGFVSLMYGLGGALVAPFRGIANYTSGTTVIEVGSLIGMAVYVLAAYLVVKAVRIAAAPHRSSAS